ncbi:MAG: hypothetical protein ACMUIA_03200 [bacterium]
MQETLEGNVIEQMLEADENACRIIEEAKEKGNRIVLQAREDAQALIEKTKEDLQRNLELLQKKLLSEGKREIARIRAEKETYLQEIQKWAAQRRELIIQEIRKKIFEDWEC